MRGSSSSPAVAVGIERPVDTPYGPARLVTYEPAGRVPTVDLVLGHGAGRGIDAPDLQSLAHALPARGIRLTLVEQPWRVAGGRVASPPARLDACWLAALRDLSVHAPARPLVVGGRSAGARVACRTAQACGATGVLALAFPLHPPGKAADPARSRLPELVGAGVPALVVQGERDTFGSASTLQAALARVPAIAAVRVVAAPYADHGLAVSTSAPITRTELFDRIANAVVTWLRMLR